MHKRFLIVDDMNQWLNFHLESCKLFFKEDFEIDFASSAHEAAVKVFENKSYDLIITDLEMEDVIEANCAGQWLLEKLKNDAKCKNTRFLIISARYNIKQIAKDAGVFYLPKSNLVNNRQNFRYKIQEILQL